MASIQLMSRVSVLLGALALASCTGSDDETKEEPANEPFPGGSVTSPSSGTSPSPGSPAAPGLPSASSEASGTQSLVLAGGTFVDKEERGSGSAQVILANGETSLRLENLNVSAGPALHVLLTKNASPSSRTDVDLGYLDLGALRATTGNLTYAIPSGTDTKAYAGAIIYCVDYKVVFSAVTLAPK